MVVEVGIRAWRKKPRSIRLKEGVSLAGLPVIEEMSQLNAASMSGSVDPIKVVPRKRCLSSLLNEDEGLFLLSESLLFTIPRRKKERL